MLTLRFCRSAVLLALWLSGALPCALGQDASRAEGAAVFASSGCVHCHGATGDGTDKGPSLRDMRRKRTAGEIQRQIEAGGGEMPAFGTVLTHTQVQALVAFLRAKTWTAPPASPPDPAR